MPASKKNYGDYMDFNGQRVKIKKHATDFSVLAPQKDRALLQMPRTAALNPSLTRAQAGNARERDKLMNEVRSQAVAHHIYQVEGTDEEIVIDDHLILELRHEGSGELERIITEYHLEHAGRMGSAHVLRLTDATRMNPVKAANKIAERPEVASCSPQVMLDMQFHQAGGLFPDQWYLAADLSNHPDVLGDSDVQAPEAWEITKGDPNIVVAVIDDGFDLEHPALTGTRLHPAHRDFRGNDVDPRPGDNDYHGTPVASIAVGQHRSNAMRGIAPNCTFLPIRIGFGPVASPINILDVFRFASEHADVVNCSFGLSPLSFDPFPAQFRSVITRLTETGGRRGKGLVMVFSAANDDAPTFLEAGKNRNGVRFTRFDGSSTVIKEIPSGRAVFSGYPMTPGVVVVGAMSSLKRKAGYSCWGPHLSVTAPSNNSHYIQRFVPRGSDPRRDLFVANYRGLGQVAAINRPGHGRPFSPIGFIDDPQTDFRERNYTKRFGGTSGAAPVVAGIAALMISANPALAASEVRQILMSTADTNLDPTLDLADDPNVQGLSGRFENGHSLFFGAGKANAFRAVRRARALAGGSEPTPPGGGGVPGPTPPAPSGPLEFQGEARPGITIPDDQPQGVVSHIDVPTSGQLGEIQVGVDISHSYRGDLRVTLTSPDGFPAVLHDRSGRWRDNVRETYDAGDNDDLADLVQGRIPVAGRWTLHVSDNARRDVGRLNSWRLDLKTR